MARTAPAWGNRGSPTGYTQQTDREREGDKDRQREREREREKLQNPTGLQQDYIFLRGSWTSPHLSAHPGPAPHQRVSPEQQEAGPQCLDTKGKKKREHGKSQLHYQHI